MLLTPADVVVHFRYNKMNDYSDLEVTQEELEYWQVLVKQIEFAKTLKNNKESQDDIFSQSTGSLRESA
jgi:hypothetical protein